MSKELVYNTNGLGLPHPVVMEYKEAAGLELRPVRPSKYGPDTAFGGHPWDNYIHDKDASEHKPTYLINGTNREWNPNAVDVRCDPKLAEVVRKMRGQSGNDVDSLKIEEIPDDAEPRIFWRFSPDHEEIRYNEV